MAGGRRQEKVTGDPAFEAVCRVSKSPFREWYEVFFELRLWGFGSGGAPYFRNFIPTANSTSVLYPSLNLFDIGILSRSLRVCFDVPSVFGTVGNRRGIM